MNNKPRKRVPFSVFLPARSVRNCLLGSVPTDNLPGSGSPGVTTCSVMYWCLQNKDTINRKDTELKEENQPLSSSFVPLQAAW